MLYFLALQHIEVLDYDKLKMKWNFAMVFRYFFPRFVIFAALCGWVGDCLADPFRAFAICSVCVSCGFYTSFCFIYNKQFADWLLIGVFIMPVNLFIMKSLQSLLFSFSRGRSSRNAAAAAIAAACCC